MMTPIKDILVPTDFGDAAENALDIAINLALAFRAKLTLLHVYEIPAWSYPGLVTPVDVPGEVERAAQQSLDRAVSTTSERMPAVKGMLAKGVVWREILAAMEHTDADLVVMGTYGRRGMDRALLGSVAEKVVRHSPVPVMTVRHCRD